MRRIHPTAIIHDNVSLGEGCIVEAYAVLGSPAEHRGFFGKPPGKVIIGKNCVIREYVTVNAGTTGDTVVGDNCWLLRGSHVGHDAVVGANVTLSCNSVVGGHAVIMDWANLGIGAAVRQRLVVGAGVMLGMNAVATKHLEPFCVYAGIPAVIIKQNNLAIERSALSSDEIAELMLAFKALCRNPL
jgi:UDP-N-acetylglucosamine acyltransferase